MARRLLQFLTLCAAVTTAGTVAADMPTDSQAQQLAAVFDDVFRVDTRDQYEVEGGVSWKSGTLIVAEGASLEKRVNAGPWSQVQIQIEPSRSQPPHVTRVSLDFQERATDCAVEWESQPAAEGKSVVVRVITLSPPQDGQTYTDKDKGVVRAVELQGSHSGSWTVTCRYGLLTVQRENEVVLHAYALNGIAQLVSCSVQALVGSTVLGRLSVAAAPAARGLSVAEDQEAGQLEAQNRRAIALYRRGDFREAIRIGEDVLARRLKLYGQTHPHVAVSRNNLGTLYRAIFANAKAELQDQSALQSRSELLGKWHPERAVSLIAVAGLHLVRRDYEQAERLYREALEIRLRVFGKESLDYAKCLGDLGYLQARMGHDVKAVRLYEQSRQITAGLNGNGSDHARILTNLGTAYHRMADWDTAENLYLQAVEILETQPDQSAWYATTLNNLAYLYQDKREFSRAAKLFRKVLEMRESRQAQSPEHARALHNLGALYHERGEYDTANSLYTQAGDIWLQTLGAKHPEYGRSLGSRGRLLQALGKFDEAKTRLTDAVSVLQAALPEHRDHAASMRNLADLRVALGDPMIAETMYRKALSVVRSNTTREAAIQSERQQRLAERAARDYLDRLLSVSAQAKVDPAMVAEDVWRWKGAVTLRQRVFRQLAANEETASLFAKLRVINGRLSVLVARRPVPSMNPGPGIEQKREEWKRRFSELKASQENLQRQVSSRSGLYRLAQHPVTAADVQRLLPKATALVDFLQYEHSEPDPARKGQLTTTEHYLAIVVTREQKPRLVHLGPASTLDELVETFRGRIVGESSQRPPSGKDDAAVQLRERVWLPIEKHCDRATTIVISPDGALARLPFAALPGPQDGSYLLEDYRIASVPMVSLLPALLEERQVEPASPSLLVVGDIDYDAVALAPVDVAREKTRDGEATRAPQPERKQWSTLPGFQDELAVVERIFRRRFGSKNLTVLDRDAATEAGFFREAPNHTSLLLITHGFAAAPEYRPLSDRSVDEEPRPQRFPDSFIDRYEPGLLSGLVLAGANKPEDDADGILTAAEIEAIPLTGVDLVVLSACETGLGRKTSGEGLLGVQRAFQVAGARTCVASLWAVSDQATKELMTRFHRNYWQKGQSRIDSMRNAQLDLMRNRELTRGDPRDLKARSESSESRRADPFYWAGFQLSGDWR